MPARDRQGLSASGAPLQCPLSTVATVIVFCIVFCARVGSARDVPEKSRNVFLHGSIEHLQHSLVESGDQGRMLELARRQLEIGNRDLAFEALLELFAQPSDAFTPVLSDVLPESTYRLALQLLVSSDRQVRFAWSRSVEPIAVVAMKQAAADPDAVISIARRFPLTQTGMHALITKAALARSRGQLELVKALQFEFQSLYAGNSNSALSEMNSAWGGGSDPGNASSTSRVAGSTTEGIPDELSLPWPAPLWTWTESIWNVPEASVFGGLNLAENRALYSLNTWQPVLADDTVFLRTPVRILAFDKNSGRVRWSLNTDTVEPKLGLDASPENVRLQRDSSLAEILQMENLGTVTTSGQYVFFIDHFRKYTAHQNAGRFDFAPAGQPGLLPLPESLKQVDGGRMVAVRLQPNPVVAWAVGDVPDYHYHFSSDALPSRPARVAIDAADSGSFSKSEFRDQKFCGTPLIHDQMLFVLSSDDEVVRLNCLAESTGRLIWEKPLIYNNDGRAAVQQRFIVNYEQPQNASLCGVDGQTIICALNSGVVIGTRVTDGQLLWATSVRDIDQTSPDGVNLRRNFGAAMVTGHSVNSIRSRPVLLPGRMIWAAPLCSTVQCLDTTTGEILWAVPRSVSEAGELEGSVDGYAITGAEGQVIMVGPRHIRALNAIDGTQQWITPLMAQAGRAFCNRKTCLVPLIDGTLAEFNLGTGRRAVTAALAAGVGNPEMPGTVVADDDVICVAGPLSITVAPTIESFRRNTSTLASVSANASVVQFDLARAELISGSADEGISGLQKIIAAPSASTARYEAEALLSETLLTVLQQSDVGTPPWSVSEALSQLQRLPLNPSQQARLAIMRPSIDFPFQTVDPLLATTTLPLEPDWQARADVAAWGALPAVRASRISAFHEAEQLTLRQVEHAILFPEHVGDTKRQLSYAKQLVADRRPLAAELLLLSAYATAVPETQEILGREVISLRESFFASPVTGRTAPLPEKLDIKLEETLALTSGSQIAIALGVSRRLADVPGWYNRKLFLTNRDIIATDMGAGVITDSSRLPTSVDPVGLNQAFDVPSIVPVTSANHVGVVSLLNSDGPQLLWWKRVDRSASDISPIEVGPFGASYLIVTTGSQLQCFHPFTGQVLWSRRTTDDNSNQSRFWRTSRFIGDGEVTAMLGRNLKSCEVFRTRDGKRLAPVSFDIPRGQTPLVSGRNLLYQKEQRLVLVDLLTGANKLQQAPELRIPAAGQARQLSDHRVVTLTDELELVVLNLQTAETELKASVSGLVQLEQVVGMTAFERDGKLFVLLKDWNTARSQRSAVSKIGDIRLDSGILCCVDLTSGKLLWHRDTNPCVVPRIYGDSTPLLLCWATQHPQYIWEQRLGRGRNRSDESSIDEQSSLVLEILDSETGKLLFEQKNLSRAEPLRCVHNAAERTITLETDTSVIFVVYGE